jgi:hypothetical protein
VRVKNPLTPPSLGRSRVRFAILSHVDARLVRLTLLNALLYWPWHWLKVDYDGGIHHPLLVLGMLVLTVWTWSQLLAAVVSRFTNTTQRGRGSGGHP